MKKLAITLFLGICILNASAQEEKAQKDESNNDEYKTLFSKKKSKDKERTTEYGGYGAISPQYTQLLDQGAFLIGGRGMLLINHHFGIGMGVNISVNRIEKRFDYDPNAGIYNPNYPLDSNADIIGNLRMGYGGIYLEYIIAPNKPIHVTIPVLIGGGYAHYFNSHKISKLFDNNNNNHNPEEGIDDYTYSSDSYFLVQPGLEIEMNLSNFFRLAVNVSYRYLYDLELAQTKSDELDGFNSAITFKFGKY